MLFMVMNYYFLFNVFLMILVKMFEEFYLNPLNPLTFYNKNVKKFKFSWAHYTKSKGNKWKLDLTKIVDFLRFLGPPLGTILFFIKIKFILK